MALSMASMVSTSTSLPGMHYMDSSWIADLNFHCLVDRGLMLSFVQSSASSPEHVDSFKL